MKQRSMGARWCLAVVIGLSSVSIAPANAASTPASQAGDVSISVAPVVSDVDQPPSVDPADFTKPPAPPLPAATAEPPPPVTAPPPFDPNATVPEPVVTSSEAREATPVIPSEEEKRAGEFALMASSGVSKTITDALPSEAGALTVRLALSRDRALPGQTVTATLQLRARQSLEGLVVSVRLPDGVDPAEGRGASAFDPATRTIRLDGLVVDKTGRADTALPLVVTTKQPGRLALEATVIPNDATAKLTKVNTLAPAVLEVGEAAAPKDIGPLGGTFTLREGLAIVTFAPGALSGEVTISGGVYVSAQAAAQVNDSPNKAAQAASDPLPTSVADMMARARLASEAAAPPRDLFPDAPMQSPLAFDLFPELTFAAPVTVTLSLGQLIPREVLQAGLTPMLHYLRETEQTITVDNADGSTSERRVKQIVLEPVASSFDPATLVLTARLAHFSAYQIGFQMPSGQPRPWKLGGLPGEVSLYRGAATFHYSIDAPTLPDGLQPKLGVSYSSAGADALGMDDYRLGYGWSMDAPRISRGLKLQKYGTGLGDNWWGLTPSDDYRLSLNGQDQNLILKSSGANRWDYVTESYTPLRVVRCRAGSDCDGLGLIIPNWNESVHAPYYVPNQDWCNTTVQQQPPAGQDYWQVFTPDGARHVFGIDAASTRRIGLRNGSAPLYSMWFLKRVYSPVRDDPASPGRWSADYHYIEEGSLGDSGSLPGYAQPCVGRGADWEDNTRLSAIYYGNSQAQSYPSYFTIGFGYDASPARLAWISTAANGRLIGLTQLGHDSHPWQGRVHTITPNAWNGSGWVARPQTVFNYTYNDPNDVLVRSIGNGYGGSAEFTYTTGSYGGKTYTVVNTRKLNDGLGNQTVEGYAYSGACFNDVGAACHFGRDSLFPESRGGLMGFNQLVKTVGPSTGGTLSRTRYDMHHNKLYIGRPYITRHYNAAGSQVLASKHESYQAPQPAPGQPNGTWLTYLHILDEFTTSDLQYDANWNLLHGATVRRTEYYVDTLGLPESTYERGFVNQSGDERSTHYGYVHNWDNWVVARPAFENVYDGIVANVGGTPLRTQTVPHYDGNTVWNATPTRGQITMVHRGHPWISADLAVDRYGYDSAGLLTSVTDARNHVSTATYDPNSMLLTSVTNPLNHITGFFYWHVNGDTNANQPWGSLHYINDPNGSATIYFYDPFGRTTLVIRPGDTGAHPTLMYAYPDLGVSSLAAPHKTEAWQREVANTGDTHPVFTFYDGLGREVQARSETVNGANQRVTNTTYDALGRVSRQYVPASESFQWGFSRPSGWDNRPSTFTQYDLLGRVTHVTGPDGAVNQHFYGHDSAGALHSTVDPLNHAKHYHADGLGRLVRVRDFTGTNPWTTYATTTYAYNALDLLTTVTNNAGHQTSMSYDRLGRKTSMSDPDMGNWSYGYDPNSNLTSQVDANGQTLTFAYDALNRLTDKYHGSTTLAWYRYDETFVTANALGRRTRTGTAVDNTSWIYDARGRATTENKYILGAGWLNTSYAYDSADRVTSMTYPNGEVVTTSYNNAMEPLQLRSTTHNLNYVFGATYNALGLPTLTKFGNTREARLRYWGIEFTLPSRNNNNYAYGRLRQICVTGQGAAACAESWGTTQPMNVSYDYDVAGNVNNVGDWPRSENLKYFYDALDRLTEWRIGSAAQETFAYDTIGNLTTKSSLGTLGYNDPAHKHAASHLNGQLYFVYDANGNMTVRNTPGYGTTTFTWNADNKITSAYSYPTGQTTNFFYDADSKRVKREDGTGTTVYAGPHYEVDLPTPNGHPGRPAHFTNALNVAAPGNGNSLQRTAGTNNWDGGASASGRITGGVGFAEARADSTNGSRMFGLSNSDPNQGYASIQYAIYLKAGGGIEIWESGTKRGDFGAYGTGDLLRVQVEWGVVRYYRQPAGGSWQHLYSSAVGASYPLYLDTSIYTSGAWLQDVKLGGAEVLRSYYSFNGQRVAMRENGVVTWIHGDHLGSASITTSGSGAKVSELRYRPYGEVRYAWSQTATDRTFTGQRAEPGLGSLMDYGARFYDPVIGRFISPDAIVPRPSDPQSLNRYGYARHSPVTRIDPTGHADFPFDDQDGWLDCDNVLDCFGSGPQLAPMIGSLTVQVSEQQVVAGPLMAKGESKGSKSSSGSSGGGDDGDGLIKKIAKAVGKAIAALVSRDIQDDGQPNSTTKAAQQLSSLFKSGTAKASELAKWAQDQGWTRTQTSNGPIKFLDKNGITRITIKKGSERAPGSNFPHVELRNSVGKRIDPWGNEVTRRSPQNHTEIDWDLP